MKHLFNSLVLTITLITCSFGQDPNILWQRTIGGSGYDRLTSIQNTVDGGIILGGESDSDISGEKTENSQGGKDFWVVKLDSQGIIEWQNTIGGSGNDILNTLSQTLDGGYIIGGSSDSDISGDKTENSNGEKDYWILKLDVNGSIVWQNTIGGGGSDSLVSIAQTPDGGYILGGTSSSGISGDRTISSQSQNDTWIVKTDANGVIQWQKAFGFVDAYTHSSLSLTNDGGFIIGGSGAAPLRSYYMIKLSELGTFQWSELYGGFGEDALTEVQQTSDGGYIVIGLSDSNASGNKTEDSQGGFDFWIIKTNILGAMEWQNTIGGTTGDACYSAIESDDGGYFICGYSDSNVGGDKTEDSNGATDYWILKLNSVGIIEWQNTIGGENQDRIPNAVQNINGEYVIGGSSLSDASGDKTENSRGDFDFWILKHNKVLGVDDNVFFNGFTLFPNPTSNKIEVSIQDQLIDVLKIYSAKGELLKEFKNIENSSIIDVSHLSTGVYYLQIISGKNIATKKFVKE
ncbi:MAG: T9SS type A sorting domain-containing protein [Altibacter sp.]|uniref:T9SS type A sorting domain-containing protein n=1 Tax=Altibacter sp. TaxID=2024823 RepID=UPI001E046286|nr:T9SS type A sorting domain-containing protein [Altibacter sp.]MBZ0328525.1 T9SS type A sorting domain-containing protein [Altibacter sp.]